MVTETQVKTSAPIVSALDSVTAALTALNAASGAGLAGFSVTLTDANGNVTSTVNVPVLLSPTQAAPFIAAMITELTAMQSVLNTALGAI